MEINKLHPKLTGRVVEHKKDANQLVVYHPVVRADYTIEGLASQVCSLLDGRRSVEEIIHEFRLLYGVNVPGLDAEVHRLLLDLKDFGLIDFE